MKQELCIEELLQIKIKDESFDVDLISQFDLCLQVAENSFNFCVVDSLSNRCLLLESYFIPQLPDRTYSDILYSIFEDHHVLMAGFWRSIKICLNNNQFSLVPSPLFDPQALNNYLTCNTTSDTINHAVYQYKHKSSDAVNVFAVNSNLINWFKTIYPEKRIRVVHHTSSFIEGVMKDNQSMSLKTMYLSLQKKDFTLVIKNENSLEYCNSFSFATPEEMIYYLVFITSALKINKNKTRLVLLGDIEEGSSLYKKITQYFKFVSFGAKPNYIRYGYMFDEIPDHRFFNLLSIYLC